MSKVVGSKLEQQSLELNFDFYKGSCQSFRMIFEIKLLPDWLIISESEIDLSRLIWKPFSVHRPQESCSVSTIPTIETVIRKLTLATITFELLKSHVVLMEQNLEQPGQVKYLIARLWVWQIIVGMLWQQDVQQVVLVEWGLRLVFKRFSNNAFELAEP